MNKNPIINITRIIFALSGLTGFAWGIISTAVNQEFAGQYFSIVLTAVVSLAITYIPDFIKDKDMLMMPIGLQVIFTLFTFCAMFLGEMLDFYERFSWWDTMLHFTSGIMFSVIGFILFVSLNRDNGVRRQTNPIIIVMFAVFFSIACGAIWEIFEFAGDSLLGMNMQKWQTSATALQWAESQNVSNISNPGLINTMKDIISDTLGSFLSIVFILPLAKYKSKYKKSEVTTVELMEEYNFAFTDTELNFSLKNLLETPKKTA